MALSTPLLGLRDKARKDIVPLPRLRGNRISKRRHDDDLSKEELADRIKKREQRATRKALDEEKRNRPRLIVGVDFGTTYSGVAYVSTAAGNKEIEVLTNWSGGGKQNDILEKVPTRIAYKDDNNLDQDAWGYVKPGLITYAWFKLLLDAETAAEEFDDPLLRQAAGNGLLQLPKGKTAADVTADYLRHLFRHVETCLGNTMGVMTLQNTPIVYQFSVPATWSQQARELTREAAEKAGFGSRFGDDLSMIDEPEAAAIATLKAASNMAEGPAFNSGSCVIILDMGGGTVDLVTYRIVKADPLRLEEACVGAGAKCGGTTIDRNLHRLMGERYSRAFSDLAPERIGAGSRFMEDFESIKRDFESGMLDETFELRLNMKDLSRNDSEIQGYAFDEHEVQLTGQDLAEMYEEVLTRTDELVLNQYQAAQKSKGSVKHLIIVGGAGSSPYVLEHYKQFCQQRFKGKVQVIRPPRAWSAICRGASLRGLEKSAIMHRLSRYHYGIKVHRKFEEGKHDEQDAFECEKYGKRARDQMEWHITKGEKLKPNTKKTIDCYYNVPSTAGSNDVVFTQEETICYSNADKAPTHARDPRVVEIDTIPIYLSSAYRNERKRLANDDSSESIEIPIEIQMTLGSDKGVINITAKNRSTKVGDQEITYQSMSAGDHVHAGEDKGDEDADVKVEM